MKSLTVIFLFFFPTLLSCNSLKVYKIAFIDISNDVRYKKWGVHPVDIRSKFNKEKRAIAGARLAIEDSKKLQRLTKINFILEYSDKYKHANESCISQFISKRKVKKLIQENVLSPAKAALIDGVVVIAKDDTIVTVFHKKIRFRK